MNYIKKYLNPKLKKKINSVWQKQINQELIESHSSLLIPSLARKGFYNM